MRYETGVSFLPAREVGEDFDQPRHGWYVPCKFLIEWVIALVLLLLTAPLVTLLGLIVRLTSPGPAFYAQERLGRYGKRFKMFKLRTMTHNCEAHTGPVWAKVNDSRVTRVGRFLRQTHLDELPQLLNVVQGEMSLVGPRPERPELAHVIERKLPKYRCRLAIRPGITGLSQVRLSPDTDLRGVSKKLAHDLYYVRELGPLVDLRIVLCTGLDLMGVSIKSVGNAMVKSYGTEAEQNWEIDEEVIDEQEVEIG